MHYRKIAREQVSPSWLLDVARQGNNLVEAGNGGSESHFQSITFL